MTRILYVEDNPQNMDLVCRILRHVGGYEVFGAVDGMAGVAEAENHKPDLILMDIQMPILDGYAATTKLRDAGFEKPIIALTAHALNEEKERALKNGFDGYLTKPLDKKQLIITLYRFLNNQ